MSQKHSRLMDSDHSNEIEELLAGQYLTVEECLEAKHAGYEEWRHLVGPSEFNTPEELESYIISQGKEPTALYDPPVHYSTTPNTNFPPHIIVPKIITKAPSSPINGWSQNSTPLSGIEVQKRSASSSKQNLRKLVNEMKRHTLRDVPPERNLYDSVLQPIPVQEGSPGAFWPFGDDHTNADHSSHQHSPGLSHKRRHLDHGKYEDLAQGRHRHR